MLYEKKIARGKNHGLALFVKKNKIKIVAWDYSRANRPANV